MDAPVALPDAQGAYREVRALPGRAILAGHGAQAPEGADRQLPVGEGMVWNESPVREYCALGSLSEERNRGQGSDRGTGTLAKAADNSYSLHPRQARLSSTLPCLTEAPPLRRTLRAGLDPLYEVQGRAALHASLAQSFSRKGALSNASRR